MKLLNKKQINVLKDYEPHFHTVIYAKYKRCTPTKVNNIVADIYEEVSAETITRNWSCAKCIYTLFEKCGKLYYKSVEALGEEKTNENKKTPANKTPKGRQKNNTKSKK